MSSEEYAIKVQKLGKRYNIYEKPQDRLKQLIFPHLRRIAGANPKHYSKEFWALQNISFDIMKGESIGIVGQNGSGKSTLLQLICGTLTPTTGSVHTHGRIAALLELGSGFNPDFTGKENVYLNGTILGLSEDEISDRYDSIASFADIGDFIDQPVKTYSSGMFVRLAFAIQVQVQPEILIIDEALAVGDALFQKRCFQRLEKLSSEGVTLLFVSHDQEVVRTLTNRAILLDKGIVKCTGSSADVILSYRKQLHEEETSYLSRTADNLNIKASPKRSEKSETDKPSSGWSNHQYGNLEAEIISVEVLDNQEKGKSVFYPGETQCIRVQCRVNQEITHLNVALRIRNKEGVKIYSWGTLNQDMAIREGLQNGALFWDKRFSKGNVFTVNFFHDCPLGKSFYEIQASISHEGLPYYGDQRMLHWIDEAAFFQITINPREYFFGGSVDLKARAKF